MSLSLQQLQLKNFRSYKDYELSNIGPVTIFVGPNGVGKTNVLEAIQLLVSQRSFKGAHTEELVNVESEKAQLSGVLIDGPRRFDIKVMLDKAEKKRSFTLNEKKKKVSQLQGLAPVVVFNPDNLLLVKKTSSVKRNALDVLGSQVNSNYYQIKKDYETLITHKNKLLKEEGDPTLIESVNDMLVVCGAQLFSYRLALFNKIKKEIASFYKLISNNKEEFSAEYFPSWNEGIAIKTAPSTSEVKDVLKKFLHNNKRELECKKSLYGPHADKIMFYVNGKPAESFASQGQQRSVVLAFKLAEVALIEEMLNKKPILLLDDVMSELDKNRRGAFVNLIAGSVQTFITTTNIEYFEEEILSKAEILKIGS